MIERNLVSDNLVTVVGTLVDVDSKVATSGSGNEYIRGKVSVRSNNKVLEMNFFTMKMTKSNQVSKLYNTYATLDTLRGKRVSITGYIDEAKVPSNGEIRKGNSLYLRFINVLADTDATPDSATFKVSGFIQEGLKAVYDEDGATVKDYTLVLAQADYTKKRSKQFHFEVNKENTAAINSINERFTVGTTCTLNGNLDFDIETITTQVQNDFGPATTRTTQRSSKRYVVTSGSLVVDDTAYTSEEISELLAGAREDDKAQLERSKQSFGTGGVAANEKKPSSAQPKLI